MASSEYRLDMVAIFYIMVVFFHDMVVIFRIARVVSTFFQVRSLSRNLLTGSADSLMNDGDCRQTPHRTACTVPTQTFSRVWLKVLNRLSVLSA